jgi:hypothetical protein
MDVKDLMQIGRTGIVSLYGRLHLTEFGKGQLCATAGYLLALKEAEHPLAATLAQDFLQSWNFLEQYGGDEEFTFPGTERTVKFPFFRIKIGSDAGTGSFTLAWYGKCDPEALKAKMEEWVDAQAGRTRADFRERLNLLEEDYRGQFEHQHRLPGQDTFHFERRDYRYSFNGGLILHHHGTLLDEPPREHGYWSIHT